MPTAVANRHKIAAQQQTATASAQARPNLEIVKITPKDVQELQSDPSPETRSRFAGKFGQQYDDFIASGSQEFADAILQFLAKDVEATVRQSLAESIAESPNLPAELAVGLASDTIEIARPILERSPVLQDEQLAEIVRSHATHYALAVAGRDTINEDLADALIDSNESDVIMRLITNSGARISNDALYCLAKDYENDIDIQDRLAQRPNLPPELVDHLLGAIGDKLAWDLVTDRSMDLDEARRLVAATKERTAKKLGREDKVEKATLRSLHERMAAGDLTALDILGFLRDGDVRKFEGSLSAMARLNSVKTRQLLYNLDKRCLAVLCLRAGLGTPQYLAVRMALDLADRKVSDGRAERAKYPTETIRFVQEQYERIRKDKKLIRQMVLQ
ncbi:MAG: DUF2336 domain-containing protein [Geminicoccales bacterium]